MNSLRNIQKRIKCGSQRQNNYNFLSRNPHLFLDPTIRKYFRYLYWKFNQTSKWRSWIKIYSGFFFFLGNGFFGEVDLDADGGLDADAGLEAEVDFDSAVGLGPLFFLSGIGPLKWIIKPFRKLRKNWSPHSMYFGWFSFLKIAPSSLVVTAKSTSEHIFTISSSRSLWATRSFFIISLLESAIL